MNNLQRLVLLAFLAVLGFFLVTEHRAHLFGALPYLFLFACPLFHLIFHRHHGSHDARDPSEKKQDPPPANLGGHTHG